MNKNKYSSGFENEFYHTSEWIKIRNYYFQINPLCELCNQYNIVTPAKVVDHILPRRICKQHELNIDNFQSLCQKCHNQKTMIEIKVNDLDTFIIELDEGKLQHITRPEKKLVLLKLLKK
ncbi:HNH endonuclease [Belliella sp. DSM 107340]|uniref:Putative HNH nuclease YajD n=1 Tax=Belliella calami TaxID=2923436 RepID=A0ABS9UJ06_9BACT|nr:HNH endonuclease signature motif containing protein [Belliella calami]MCH7396552.1 HNH endonuclease [Belliella calami]